MNIYLSNGYLNIEPIAQHPSWLKVLIGGRQIGKTFNTLHYHLEHNIQHLLLRRTTEELELIQSTGLSPYSAFMPEYQTGIFKQGKLLTIRDYDENGPKEQRGLVMSLSQIAHIRGFNASFISSMIFDEFIPEPGVRVLKTEGDALLNAYTTINGNRELSGDPPLTLWLLANSNRIDSPILEALGLTDDIIRMRSKHLETFEREGVLIVQPESREVMERRKETALLKTINSGSEFYGMAVDNKFAYDESPLIKSQNIKYLKPLFGYAPLYAWEGSNNIYFCRMTHKKDIYKGTKWDKERLRSDYGWIIRAYAEGLVTFADLHLLSVFKALFDIDF